MEIKNKNIVIKRVLLLVIFSFFILSINLSLAYAVKTPNSTTHQYITREAGKVWTTIPLEISNHLIKDINDTDTNGDYDSIKKDDIITGSVEEDYLTRPIGHFWEPDHPTVSGSPYYGDGLGTYPSSYLRAQKYWSDEVVPYYTGSDEGNLFFKRRKVDQGQAYYMLGRTAHLLEDATSVSHVLLDAHGGTPFGLPFGGNSVLEDWAAESENFNLYNGSNYSGQEYDYNNLINNFDWSGVQPPGLSEDELNLFKLFWYTAQKTQYWASDDNDANYIYRELNNDPQSWSCEEAVDNNLWADEYTSCSNFIDEAGELNENNVQQEADAVIPHAMKAVAGLYRLFWETVREELRLDPTNSSKSKVRGGVRNNSTWRTELNVVNSNSKDIAIRLSTTNCNNDLSLILSNPSRTTNYSGLNANCLDFVRLDNPTQGMWEVIVEGDSVSSGIQEFEVSVEFVEEESIDNDDVGGINFTSINLDYISTCDSGEIKLVMKGEEAQGNDPILNVTEATNQATDFFLTALIIPNHKMWITMDAVPGNGPFGRIGDVSRVDDNLAHTKLGQVMFDADIQLKVDQWVQSQSLIKGLINDWVDDVTHNPKIVPDIFAGVWITSDSIEANGTGCETFITNSALKVQTQVFSVSLKVGGYESELATFRTNLENGYANLAAQAEIKVNSDPAYEEIRRAHASIALAQWYKQQPRNQVPFGNIIDSENVSDFYIDFDQAYYESEAWRHLYTFYYHGKYWITFYGGVELVSSDIESIGNIPTNTALILENTSLKPYVQNGSDVYYTVESNPQKSDLIPLVLGFSELTPDANNVTNITVLIINDGEINTTDTFNVRFSYEFTYPNGFVAEYYIGEQNVNGLTVGETKLASVLLDSSLIGYHNITARIDYNNVVEELSEQGNEISEVIEFVDPNPVAEILYPVSGTQYGINQTIQLIGIGTDRKDGDLNESLYNWTSDVEGYLGNGSLLSTILTAPGAHIITLNIKDSDGNSHDSQILINFFPSVAPIVTLNTPLNGQVFQEGDTVYFDGEVFDEEDGILNGSSLMWNSTIDGLIGTGESFGLSSLSVGVHNITFSGIDSSGIPIKKIVIITVEESTPIITVYSPGNNSQFFYFQNNITFNGSVSDPHEGDLSSQLFWTSSLEGDIGFGSVLYKVLSAGDHIISAFVTDNFGLSDTLNLYLSVFDPLPPVVSITSPTNNLIVYNGDMTFFRGIANDPETGALLGDNVTWESSLDGNIGNGTEFNITNFTTFGTHEITLLAIDPDNQTSSVLITLEVRSALAEVNISSFDSEYLFEENSSILFNATVIDYEDGELNGSSLVWYSDGIKIGTGNSFNLSNLSVGSHIITLNATDSDGAVGTEDKTIIVVGIGSHTLNVFSDGSSTKSLSFNPPVEQKVVYVKIPKNANITSATLNIRGSRE